MTLNKLKERAFENPEVKSEYDRLSEAMTLNEWRLAHRLRWCDIARKLGEQGNGPVLEGRLNRLRRGKAPTTAELTALIFMTDDEVDSFRDE